MPVHQLLFCENANLARNAIDILPVSVGLGEVGCGRDGGFPPPPAQIRTCRITAYGSCLGYLTRRSVPQGEGAYSGLGEDSSWPCD